MFDKTQPDLTWTDNTTQFNTTVKRSRPYSVHPDCCMASHGYLGHLRCKGKRIEPTGVGFIGGSIECDWTLLLSSCEAKWESHQMQSLREAKTCTVSEM